MCHIVLQGKKGGCCSPCAGQGGKGGKGGSIDQDAATLQIGNWNEGVLCTSHVLAFRCTVNSYAH